MSCMWRRSSAGLLLSTTGLGAMFSIALAGCANGPANISDHSHPLSAMAAVTIKATDADVFDPISTKAKVGDVVEWTNVGTHPHNINIDTQPTLDGDLAPGTRWQLRFSRAGTYSYRCTIHPNMTAQVTVG